MRCTLASRLAAPLLVLAAACAQDRNPAATPPPDPGTKDPPHVQGLYEVSMTGFGTDNMSSTVRAVRDPSPGSSTLTTVGSGLSLEAVSSSSFIDGTRAGGGQRYISFTFRVRNATGSSLTNLTLLPVSKSNTIVGTALSQFARFDGSAVDPSQAQFVAPTGAVALGPDFNTMYALYPDVLQTYTEAEVSAIPLPAGVTSIFPVGYVVRNKNSNANRTLPSTTDPNQWDGLLTIAFRVPLQPATTMDVFSATFQFVAITDDEVKMTESIEESQDTAAVRRLRDRASSLGATTVTVMNGSPAMDPAVPDYPGQRQICSPRTAGTSGSPTATIVTPGGYAGLMILRPGETMDYCGAYFRAGTPGRPATNVPFNVTVKAVDRYGNVKTAQADSVHVTDAGPPCIDGPGANLVSGSATQTLTWSGYGSSTVTAVGKRLTGTLPILVAGVTRTWTAGAGTTDWFTANNWSPAAVPMSQDSVYIPLAAPLDPALTANVQIGGVTVEDGALIALGAFDMTAGATVTAGLNGGITNTSGRLFLTGIGQQVTGKMPPLRVTGTYSLSANVNARAVIQVDAGRLTVSALRLQADSY